MKLYYTYLISPNIEFLVQWVEDRNAELSKHPSCLLNNLYKFLIQVTFTYSISSSQKLLKLVQSGSVTVTEFSILYLTAIVWFIVEAKLQVCTNYYLCFNVWAKFFVLGNIPVRLQQDSKSTFSTSFDFNGLYKKWKPPFALCP